MGVRVVFPEWNANAYAYIKPPFEIPAYEPLASAAASLRRYYPNRFQGFAEKSVFSARLRSPGGCFQEHYSAASPRLQHFLLKKCIIEAAYVPAVGFAA